ncbi:MAG TPA: PsbP-related protein, partial [Chitinophagales bacterium]|nr:PsbP-related protein [Chitinophagales bacterium]
QLVATLERPQKVDSTALQIDEKNALRVAYTGTVGIKKIKERIYYQLVFVEGKKHYYQIVLWTWDQWRQKYQADFEHIVQSFKEQ